MKSYSRKAGSTYVMHAGEGVYSIAQVIDFGFILFFNHFTKNPNIKNLDLNKIDILFCGQIFSPTMKRDGVHKLTKADNIIPVEGYQYPTKWIMAENFLNPVEPKYLVEFKDHVIAKNLIINKRLVTVEDKDIIKNHEMMNLETSPAFRLNFCYHAGRYVNPLRDIFFQLEDKVFQISDNPITDYFDINTAFYYRNFPESFPLDKYLKSDPKLLDRLKQKKLIL